MKTFMKLLWVVLLSTTLGTVVEAASNLSSPLKVLFERAAK